TAYTLSLGNRPDVNSQQWFTLSTSRRRPAPDCSRRLSSRIGSLRYGPASESAVNRFDEPPLKPPEDEPHGARDHIPGGPDRGGTSDRGGWVQPVHGVMARPIAERPADEQRGGINAVVGSGGEVGPIHVQGAHEAQDLVGGDDGQSLRRPKPPAPSQSRV